MRLFSFIHILYTARAVCACAHATKPPSTHFAFAARERLWIFIHRIHYTFIGWTCEVERKTSQPIQESTLNGSNEIQNWNLSDFWLREQDYYIADIIIVAESDPFRFFHYACRVCLFVCCACFSFGLSSLLTSFINTLRNLLILLWRTSLGLLFRKANSNTATILQHHDLFEKKLVNRDNENEEADEKLKMPLIDSHFQSNRSYRFVQ